MPLKVLLVQSDRTVSQVFSRFFAERGDQVWQSAEAENAFELVEEHHPDVVLVDLHMPGNGWLALLRQLHHDTPRVKIIVTNKYPDFQRELLAKEQGAQVFLRQPFTNQWIESALKRLDQDTRPVKKKQFTRENQPRVRFPVRIKITIPYVALALMFALAGAYLVSQVVMQSIEDRFNGQLVETGKQSADWMVQAEDGLLKTLRLVANTQGVAGLVRGGDAEGLRGAVLPLAVNSGDEAIEILDTQGVSLLAMRHVAGGNREDYSASRGENVYQEWDFVQYVLDGRSDNGLDKSAGMANSPWGNYFYVSGPILDESGALVGVVLVGKSLPTLVRQMHEDTLANVSLYDYNGQPLATTLLSPEADLIRLPADQINNILGGQDVVSLTRLLTVGSNEYSEILGPWEARSGQDIGILGVSLARQFLFRTSQVTRTQIFLLVSIAFLLVIVVGVLLANQITRPLLRVVRASTQVAQGNLEVKVEPSGDDEVAVLAHSFNSMVAGLQEGSIYRDLLGRTVSPEVREQLRQTFTSGNVRLEGQEAIATVLMTDIRGFTSLSEKSDPATVFNWLNEYFSDLVPIITNNNGVVNKFDGDAMLAFFGILPKLLSPKQSAYYACKAAVEMLAAIEQLNVRRVERGEPLLATGIGLNTGVVTAGGLGTSDRLHYTIIGDTVNTTQRLESLTRNLFSTSGALISQSTFSALGEKRQDFSLEPMGMHLVKGKAEQLLVYRLQTAGAGSNGKTSEEARIAALRERF